MSHIFRAFLWLRWRLLVNAIKGSRRRDSLERMSRAAAMLTPILLGVLFIPTLLAAAVLATLGGWAIGTGRMPVHTLVAILRVLLAAVTVAVVIAPAVRSVRGASSGLSRFVLLPIPRGLLFASDTITGLADPWIALLVPVLLLLPLGIAASGKLLAAALALAGGLGMLAFLLLLESSVSYLLGLLYRNRRRGEMATLAVLIVLSLSGFLPMLMSLRSGHFTRPRTPGHEKRLDDTVAGLAEKQEREGMRLTIPPIVPSELYGRAIVLAVSGRPAASAGALAGLWLFAAAALGVSWAAYRRLLDTPEGGASHRTGGRTRHLALALPVLSPAASAVALATIRLVLRSVQGKMAVYFTPVSMLLFAFVFSRVGGVDLEMGFGEYAGPFAAMGGILISLLSMQKMMLNQFAIDGPGLTLQLLAPLSEREIVTGKAAGMGLLLAASTLFYFVIFFALAPASSPWLWPAVILAGAAAYLVFAPASALLSAVFPKQADLSRIGRSGNPNQLAAFIGLFLALLAFLPSVVLMGLGLFILKSPLLSLVIMGAWAILSAALSVPLFRLAARVVESRRENLGLVAQGR